MARSCDDANVAGASEVHSHVTTGETRAYWQYKVVSIGRVNPQLAAALAQARAKCCVLGNIHARPPVARCRIWPDGPACPVHCRRTRALRRSVHAAPLRCFGRKARRLISELTRAALAIRKANSGRLGNPANKACFAVRQSNSTQNKSHSGRSDMMPPAMSASDAIVLQKSFCTGDEKFCGPQARLSCKDVRGPHRLALNSQATSAGRLRRYKSAIASPFRVFAKNRGPALSTFATQSML